jgi:hypothetical protein
VPSSPIEETILAAEASRCAAMAGRDLDALEALLDDDLRYGHTSGLWDTKPEYLGKLRTGALAYPAMSSIPTGFRASGDLALLWIDVHATVITPAGQREMRNASLTIWMRTAAGVRMTAHHPTVLPQSALPPPETGNHGTDVRPRGT